MKDVARGTAAVAPLPSKETLSGAYFELRARIDQIVAQAQAEGSLSVAISGLNSLRQTLDSLSRLAGHDRATTEVNVAVRTNVGLDLTQIAEGLIESLPVRTPILSPLRRETPPGTPDFFPSRERSDLRLEALHYIIKYLMIGGISNSWRA